jgi:DnaA family protein
VFKQLPLSFTPREVFNFASYVSGDNHLAVAMIQQLASAAGEKQIYLCAGKGQGKSHLLQAACNHAARRQASVCYLPAAEIIAQPVQIFEGLEQLDLLCLDDIQLFAGDRAWEEALFDLSNRVRSSRCNLLLSSNDVPENIGVQLPDLRSRLAWGPVFQLLVLGDAQKREALQLRARLSGLELPENVADYLLRHYPRDLFGLFERLDLLDTAAMAMQRRLTIPFVKTVFAHSA